MHLKLCSRCRNRKPFDAFDHSRRTRDNRHHRCKDCDRWREKEERIPSGSRDRSVRRWAKNHPRAVAAHAAVNNAIRRGALFRGPCSVCGCAESHAHHEDYDKPLKVIWLCVRCHAEHHRLERQYGIGQTLFEFFKEGRL